MDILLTLRQPLLPADTGGKVRSLNIFSRLAKRATIHAVSFADPLKEAVAISDMKDLFASYTPVPWQEAAKYSPGFYTEVLANQFSRLPYSLAKCNQRNFQSAVAELAVRKHFDMVLCDFLHTAAPLLGFASGRKVVFEHNVEFLLRKRQWEMEKRLLHQWIYDREWRKTRAIEARVCQSFEHTITVSEEDQQVLRREFGIENVSTLPTGVDTDYFCPSCDLQRPGRLVFVGSMDWAPNEDGIVWFLREVYPKIQKAIPSVSFAVVGRNPSPRLRAIAGTIPNVEVTGRVSDVRPYLSDSEVVVVPLRVGGGTRIKIPEAMAMAKPVVSTPIGAEGLPFRKDQELCIAERAEDFSKAVVTLLRYPAMRTAIGAAAREAVVARHSWDTVVDEMEEILERVLRETGNQPSIDRQLLPVRA
jgi:sugar transferase (PEP-CTERM/EpsH1 system associated)